MENENKKDLTNLFEIQREQADSGLAPPLPAGSLLEEVPIEEMSNFESLEDYSEAHPESEQKLQEESNVDEFEVSPPPGTDVNSLEALEQPPLFKETSLESQAFDPQPDPLTTETPPKPLSTLDQVKNFSEKVTLGLPNVPAAFPFSILIHGFLLPEEKEKLLDLLSRENMGIREIDLEPQLTGDRILIPRISEYAAILIVQALRGIRGEIKVGPSDTIFSTIDTRADQTEEVLASEVKNESAMNSEVSHPAENLPVTSEDRLPHVPRFTVIDAITATAALKSSVVETESTPEYQEVVEALQREIKYKAYRKGAIGVVNFKIQLTFLSSPSHYRLQAMGLAIRPMTHLDTLPPPRPNQPASA